MSYTIDISKDNIRQYTSEEIRDLADRGVLTCGDFCLSEFVNKILVDLHTSEELEASNLSSYNDGHDNGYSEGYDAGLDDQ